MATLDDEERAHLEELRAIDRRNLRILERQITSYGEDDAPQYMIARRDELRIKLGWTGKMVRGEFTEEILDMFRQFGQTQALGRAITDVSRELYDFKKETWDYRNRDQIARQEQVAKNDTRFGRIETTIEGVENKARWVIVIALIIAALVLGYVVKGGL